jgi:hypothetical protein
VSLTRILLIVLTLCFICRLFNVVWGKQSNMKHKTWEGYGILEVVEKTVILKVNCSTIGISEICFIWLTSGDGNSSSTVGQMFFCGRGTLLPSRNRSTGPHPEPDVSSSHFHK